MKFEVYFKEGDLYNKRLVAIPSGNSIDFLKSLKMTIDNELENIKVDFLLINKNINLKRPSVEDHNEQKIIDKLVDIRRQNLDVKQALDELLCDQEFIICEQCNTKMYKKPVNVKYEMLGKKFLIKEPIAETNIRYHYVCDTCVIAVDEGCYLEKQRNKEQREKLLKEGINFVPNDYGMWNWKKKEGEKGIKYISANEEECSHSLKRSFEYIKINGTAFVKIIEKCVNCGIITHQK